MVHIQARDVAPEAPVPAERAGDKVVRVAFDFSKAALDRLDELKKKMGAVTRAEVVRTALKLLLKVIEEKERGAKLTFERPDGKLVEYDPW